ncbi:hypothetical protein BDD12DRAFT_913934 [Trichophaea hybrida]|nr:hypothetical protein BDD12DRAFT_913934 [Trichophaea hybrida]
MISLRTVYLDYGTSISQELEKRSTNGNEGLTAGETAGLVVGILGLFLTALTVCWKCWKYRKFKDQTNSTAPDGSSSSHITTVSHHVYHHFPSMPGFPGQDIALETIHRGNHSGNPLAMLQQSTQSPPHLLHPLPPLPSPSTMPLSEDRIPALSTTVRSSTWPTSVDVTNQGATAG